MRAQLAGQTVIELQQVKQRIAADALHRARGGLPAESSAATGRVVIAS